jgi:hypothetical protein
MAIGRIPGPLGDAAAAGSKVVSSKLVGGNAALGSAGSDRKPVPTGIADLILFPPPVLCQLEAYKGTEGMYGCWATVAEMIIKHRNPSTPFSRPAFEKLLADTSTTGRVNYMDFVDRKLADWGFRPVPGGMLVEWEISTVASSVRDFGPLLCDGKFWDGASGGLSIGGDIHCIAVFGGRDGLVYYRDPWDGAIKTMPIAEFNRKGRSDPFRRARNVLALKRA